MCAEFVQGQREIIGLKEETVAYGTWAAPAAAQDMLGREARWNPSKNSKNWQEIRGAGTDTIIIDVRETGPETFGGTLNFAPQYWNFLKYVLCDGSSDCADAAAGSNRSHTLTNAVDIASFSMERAKHMTGASDIVARYEGCQVETCSITWDAGGGAGGALVDVSLDITAEDMNFGTTAVSVVVPTVAAYQYTSVDVTLNNAAVVEVVGGTINIENNLNPARWCDYSTIAALKGESAPQIRRFNGSFRIVPKDNTWEALWDAAAALTASNTVAFTRGTNDLCTFTMEDVLLDTAIDPTNLDGNNEMTINWVAEDITVIAEDDVTTW